MKYCLILLAAKLALATNDAHRNFVQMCQENGWATESHTVITLDGYVSQLFRIPGKAGEQQTRKPAVMMMAGIECDMNFWLANDPEITPAFVLAAQGFDVWLANNRGTRYGTAHVSLITDQEEFWNFNQEDLGLYDLPANIDFILKHTGQQKLTYVGHSQGTTQMLLAASLNPLYFQNTVNLFVALAPVASLNHVQVPVFQKMAKLWRPMQYAAKKYGAWSLFDSNWWEEESTLLFCAELDGICDDLLAYFADSDPAVDNLARFNVFMKDFPAGTGFENLVYYAQDVDNDFWRRFNYGELENVKRYGTIEPPLVPIENLKIPVGVFSGSFDELADPTDVSLLVQSLGSNVVYNKEWPLGHLSFSLALDMSWFTTDAVNLIRQYSTNTNANFLQ